MTEKSWVEDLPVELTERETIEFAQRMGGLLAERRQLEATLAEIRRDYKERLDAIEKELERRGLALTTGAEPRPVRVREVLAFDRGLAEIVRDDTGEVIRSREIVSADRQKEIEV